MTNIYHSDEVSISLDGRLLGTVPAVVEMEGDASQHQMPMHHMARPWSPPMAVVDREPFTVTCKLEPMIRERAFIAYMQCLAYGIRPHKKLRVMKRRISRARRLERRRWRRGYRSEVDGQRIWQGAES